MQTSEHMSALGVFGLIQVDTFIKYGLAPLPQSCTCVCVRACKYNLDSFTYTYLTSPFRFQSSLDLMLLLTTSLYTLHTDRTFLAKRLFYSLLVLAPIRLVIMTSLGYVAPFSGRFYSLWYCGMCDVLYVCAIARELDLMHQLV